MLPNLLLLMNLLQGEKANQFQKGAFNAQQRALNQRTAREDEFLKQEQLRAIQERLLGLQTAEGANKIRTMANQEAQEARSDLNKTLDPYRAEQKKFMEDPVGYQQFLNNLMKSSPFAARADNQISTSDNRIDNTSQVQGIPQGSVRDNLKNEVAQKILENAMYGFSNDRRLRQQDAIKFASQDYDNKIGDIESKYSPQLQNLYEKLGVETGYGGREGGMRGLGLDMFRQGSREGAQLQSNRALTQGRNATGNIELLKDFLKDNFSDRDDQDVNGYSSLGHFIADKTWGKDLSGEDKQTLALLLKRKGKKINLTDIFNNIGREDNYYAGAGR